MLVHADAFHAGQGESMSPWAFSPLSSMHFLLKWQESEHSHQSYITEKNTRLTNVSLMSFMYSYDPVAYNMWNQWIQNPRSDPKSPVARRQNIQPQPSNSAALKQLIQVVAMQTLKQNWKQMDFFFLKTEQPLGLNEILSFSCLSLSFYFSFRSASTSMALKPSVAYYCVYVGLYVTLYIC